MMNAMLLLQAPVRPAAQGADPPHELDVGGQCVQHMAGDAVVAVEEALDSAALQDLDVVPEEARSLWSTRTSAGAASWSPAGRLLWVG